MRWNAYNNIVDFNYIGTAQSWFGVIIIKDNGDGGPHKKTQILSSVPP
jgi:hypothetical protein